jgi:hypothetical protein
MVKRLWTLVALLLTLPVEADTLLLTAADWAQPRGGEQILQHPVLVQAMETLRDKQRLQLVYPGGDEGLLWASELQAWLVALGLPLQRMELLPGSPRPDVLELRID